MNSALNNEKRHALISLFKGIDRHTLVEELPENCIHFHKEVFKCGSYIIKKTNYKKNGKKDHYLFENEAFWLGRLQKYPFVPNFYGKYYHENDIYLIIEYIHGVSIDKTDKVFLKQFFPFFRLFEKKLHDILEVFASENITHKDLRPHNIIIHNSFKACSIIDYQFCSAVGEDLPTNCDLQAAHYKKAMNSVGGQWRMPNIESHTFTSDRYAVEKVLNDLQNRISELQRTSCSRTGKFLYYLRSIIHRKN